MYSQALKPTVAHSKNNASRKREDGADDKFRGLSLLEEDIGKYSYKNGICGDEDHTACHRCEFQGAYPQGKMEGQKKPSQHSSKELSLGE